MPNLREFLEFARELAAQSGESFSDHLAIEIERQVRQRWPGERIYLMPGDSRKDPARAERIAAAARLLPTGVVSERFGISRKRVYQLQKVK
jgi:hypothetical protein